MKRLIQILIVCLWITIVTETIVYLNDKVVTTGIVEAKYDQRFVVKYPTYTSNFKVTKDTYEKYSLGDKVSFLELKPEGIFWTIIHIIGVIFCVLSLILFILLLILLSKGDFLNFIHDLFK